MTPDALCRRHVEALARSGQTVPVVFSRERANRNDRPRQVTPGSMSRVITIQPTLRREPLSVHLRYRR
ncbi:MAG: hypothetical protein Q8S73_26965 [Deltaproteobacteria bacterium]|nr:hypothetical protein [Myxococcales bacterium]MDP3217779.1 hypothetical protein [Deltaproteobacteria bacterium]